jgi:NDP-sugar pyrophosphorylase family protein
MKALILLGGLGTRLRPFTLDKPKPLLPILNRPFFAYQLDQIKQHGVDEAVLALGYHAAHFRKHLGDGRRWGMKFVYSFEKEPLGTGGAIRNALKHLEGDRIFVMNGDILSDVDLGAALRFHEQNKAHGTIVLIRVQDPTQFGLIETDADGRVRKFLEKPSADQITTDTVNAGYYIFEPSIVPTIPAGRQVSIEREVFPQLVAEGVPFFGYVHAGRWVDVGTLKTYRETHLEMLRSFSANGAHGVQKLREGLWAGKGAKVHPSARVEGAALLGAGCRVAAGAVLSGAVLGAGCVVGEGAELADCVVHDKARIGRQARLDGCVVGERADIGEHSRIGPGAAVAARSKVGPYSQLAGGKA